MELTSMELNSTDKVHIIGIGGAGMSALATILHQRDYSVTGSDLKASAIIEKLVALGIEVNIGHDVENIKGADVVAYSSAVRESNPELKGARESGKKVMDRASLLTELCKGLKVITISGTHGKTTTTSMMSLALVGAGLDPTFVVGGELNEVGSGARSGSSEFMVVEADESDGTHLRIPSYLAILTNVEPDHLDYYGSLDNLEAAFSRYIAGSTMPAIVCADDGGAMKVAAGAPFLSYGFSPKADFWIDELELFEDGSRFSLFRDDRRLVQLRLAIPGRHNVLNASGVLAAASTLGLSMEAVAVALSRFTGVARRFQPKGSFNSAPFYDDYAHLPSEISVTLQSARQVGGGRRVVAVFQPHRYSRTKELAYQLGKALAGSDFAVVADVYSAGEAAIPGISGLAVAEAAREFLGDDRVLYQPSRSELAKSVARIVRPNDLVVTLGAGDITALFWEIKEFQSAKE